MTHMYTRLHRSALLWFPRLVWIQRLSVCDELWYAKPDSRRQMYCRPQLWLSQSKEGSIQRRNTFLREKWLTTILTGRRTILTIGHKPWEACAGRAMVWSWLLMCTATESYCLPHYSHSLQRRPMQWCRYSATCTTCIDRSVWTDHIFSQEHQSWTITQPFRCLEVTRPLEVASGMSTISRHISTGYLIAPCTSFGTVSSKHHSPFS